MARRREGLSDRHKKILEVLGHFQETVGYPPSIREIGKEADISSTSVVNYYLDQLEEMGYIERDRKVSRGMRLIKTATGEMLSGVKAAIDDVMRIPLAGRIGAGEVFQPPPSGFSVFDPDESVEVARSLLNTRDQQEPLFALEVEGNSMIDAMVNSGDIVVMKQAQEAVNGEMVAVRLADDDMTTLKYFYKENGKVRLQPANPTIDPIIVDDPSQVEVQGKVVLVIRQIDASPI
ncbi:MAG: repressor LexA [Chloroflexi bacterium]|jgi:repressor LexA|nr:repressor LexA [Chloroflexota bacterium]MBT3669216.1 repressor LexA [Chloroflexota bacterium]MBT4004088.1 repressor LexA [Chloroflexota bacterium]MBT4306461.1 repressor LexA [Chloroflexota bacterium]MBT4534960.1 repressor LexA [Chloroflexota bacterium]